MLSSCHPLAHAVGHAAFAFYGTVDEGRRSTATAPAGRATTTASTSSTWSQFDDSELVSVIPTICHRPKDNPYAFDYYNCVHGIGHGVTIRFGNDPFKGLPYCDVFKDRWEQANCYTGVFMQNIIVDRKWHKSVRLDPDDPVYPCDAVEHKYKDACYLGQTSYVLRGARLRLREGVRALRRVEEEFVSTCYVSMGRDISGNSHREATRSSSAAASAIPSTRRTASSAPCATPSSTTTARRTPTRCAPSSPSATGPAARTPATTRRKAFDAATRRHQRP